MHQSSISIRRSDAAGAAMQRESESWVSGPVRSRDKRWLANAAVALGW